MKTLILTGEVGRDGKLRVELSADVLPGQVEVTVRPLSVPEPARGDWFQFLLNARARMEAAGCHSMNDKGVQTHIDKPREDFDRIRTTERKARR